jgi:hypothetical protein
MDEKPERRSLDIFMGQKQVGASPLSPSRCFYPDRAFLSIAKKNLVRTKNFLVRTKKFLVRTKNFLVRTKNFLARTKNFLARTKNLLVRTKNFLARTKNFLARTKNFLARTKNLLVRTKNFLVRTKNLLVRTKNLLVRTKNLLVRTKKSYLPAFDAPDDRKNPREKNKVAGWRLYFRDQRSYRPPSLPCRPPPLFFHSIPFSLASFHGIDNLDR